jgi:hypothetical protein
MSDAVRSWMGTRCVIGALKGICLGPLTGPRGATLGYHLTPGIHECTTDGYPGPPCLQIDGPGFFRFFQVVIAGTQTWSVWCKQDADVFPYPSMLAMLASGVGPGATWASPLGEGNAPAGTGWKEISMVTYVSTPSVAEFYLINNLTSVYGSPALFDNFTPPS